MDHWGGRPDFSRVIGYDGDEVVGFAYGAPAVEGREWWREWLEAAPERTATFHFSDLSLA
ncbi:hypothetical protein [Streptomyces sp. NPDC005435]|uniref:hypothetical protein n=1 Tax=Streptomyces sp. NPDC005435 TaxID=3154464 RepID=UPI003451845D